MSPKPIWSNENERYTGEELEKYTEGQDAEVFKKVRVADVLEIEGSGISDQLYSYALKAHFDFVVAQGSDGYPKFAVEFDEFHHRTDPDTIERDRKKENIYHELGLPLFRITREHLEELGIGEDPEFSTSFGSMFYKHYSSTIGWLTDMWFTREAFFEAKEQGKLPYDAVWSSAGVQGPDAGLYSHIGTAYKKGAVLQKLPTDYIAQRDPRDAEVVTAIPLPEDEVVYGHSRCKTVGYSQDSFPRDVARLTATNAAVSKIRKYFSRGSPSYNRGELEKMVSHLRSIDEDLTVLNNRE
jgi:hypothetical protein